MFFFETMAKLRKNKTKQKNQDFLLQNGMLFVDWL